jgi:hypothetical protein
LKIVAEFSVMTTESRSGDDRLLGVEWFQASQQQQQQQQLVAQVISPSPSQLRITISTTGILRILSKFKPVFDTFQISVGCWKNKGQSEVEQERTARGVQGGSTAGGSTAWSITQRGIEGGGKTAAGHPPCDWPPLKQP